MGDAFEAGDAVVDGDQHVGAAWPFTQVDDRRRQPVAVDRAVGHDVVERAGSAPEHAQAAQATAQAVAPSQS
jgi:hypothetical protein